jgi:hypothetical protein
MEKDYHKVTIHEFKSNISRYIRELDWGRWDGILVCRHSKPVGMFFSVKAKAREARYRKK